MEDSMYSTKSVWSLVAVVAVALFAVSLQAEDFQLHAQAIVADLAARNFDKIAAQFDATMAASVPPAKLATAWDSVVASAGPYKSIAGMRQQEQQTYQVVVATCQFERARWDVRVVMDSKGKVAGLFMAPTPVARGNANPSEIDGDWLGTVDLGPMKLRMVLHLLTSESGLQATMDSPDQNANGIPVDQIIRSGDNLKLVMKNLKAELEGKFSADRTTFTGTLNQGANFPVVLKRINDKTELAPRRRPQDPVKPYPYREEEVRYKNPSAGNDLAATFTIPMGQGPFPAVILLTGSGPQDRDESLLGHKPFLVLSDYLTRRGIAVLRADDRGVGKSTGDFNTATSADFATDAEAGIAFLKTRPEVDRKKIGLVGHSEGGIIAPMVAARNRDVAFIVLMAGSGVRGDQIMVAQSQLISESSGLGHEQAEKNAAKEGEILALVVQEKDNAVLEKKVREKLAGAMPEAALGAEIQKLNSPWLRYFISYDPAMSLRKVRCPVLALNGSKDMQVPSRQNLPTIRKALEEGGNKNIEVIEFPGLNHLFQTANTGAPSEYAQIDETIAPVVLDKIAAWIRKVTSR
ncbi:MAG: alpha/beta hydrolase [Candidatus Angelobacter sp. Gp1-AA117]|nr:MAG: alpha/beta hydrolase [Candidatus Angelobacter sp. Gp1-AA117]